MIKYLFLFAGASLLMQNTIAQQAAPLPATKNKFVVVAHRGNHVDMPENTVAAIAATIQCGADYAELDLRTTKDGQLVLMHDATVDRMTNGKGKVADLTWAEIQLLKINSKDGKDYRVPTFSEALRASKGKVNIYLDFKDADVAETWKQIQAAGMEQQIVVYLNGKQQYKQWRKTAPQMPLMTSVPDEVTTPAQLNYLLDNIAIAVLDNVTDSAMLAVTRQHGVAVWLDAQASSEGPATWNTVLSKGVQGMQSDHPEALVSYLKKNNLRDGSNGSALPAVASSTRYITMRNVPYGDAGEDNTLDAYLPENHSANTKIIVYLHGGGWTGGDKKELPKQLIEELAGKLHYGVVSMNYRLIRDHQNIYPAQLDDVKKALAFISSKSKKLPFDGNQFALIGGSAGAYLAMQYAYACDSLRQIKTVVDLWGPTDFTDKKVRQENKDADEKVTRLLGEPDPAAKIAFDASPFHQLTKASGVPTILFHGGQDPLVDVNQAKKLHEKLTSLHIPTQIELYPTEKHGMGLTASMDVFVKVITWLKQYYPAE
ncbi:glycerophosphodiester phosphodiesterase family protein [Chitinophaga nivalis]|uniref:Glycerophosphodiester phosphodiesterase family protein n=1 Tax=Chitinophaga nivalis TaxID=2991709 RepID=A0ABT3IN56_9BACT|nr:glycerophosphodiester phosphodiesterase family protein [Chitinophaga nivalis]MCW3464908.1 glycerophosphodiester phosphodiesterase family protein [Chitinophaga nivalis]MCW3485401.1 glycerophosphodiester phosphodiesterase family protein [Chitinophaga nivalis]